MASHRIPFYTFGTYYTKNNPDPGPHAHEMKNFAYWLKAKWSCEKIQMGHPLHPGEFLEPIANSAAAYDYMAEMVEANIKDIRGHLDLKNYILEFIPVPSSDVTRPTVHTARWSGREIASRLQDKGLGKMGLHVVNKYAIKSKGDGADASCDALAQHYEVIGQINEQAMQVYIDDVLTWGKHVAAMHIALGLPDDASLLAAARTDKGSHDAYDVRTGYIEVTRFANTWSPNVVAQDPDPFD